MSDRVVGVVFDDTTLRAVELRHPSRFRRGAGDQVLRACSAELPPGVVDRGEIADAEAFADSLRALWVTAGFTTTRVSIGLDARAAVIRRATFPAVARKSLQQAAEFEIGDLLGYRLDQALVSVLDVGKNSGGTPGDVQCLVLATKQDTIIGLRAAVKAAGLRPVSTELTQTALARHVNGPNPLPDGAVGVIVDVSRTVTNIVVHENDGMLFSRVVTAGVSALPTSLSDELQKELTILDSFGQGEEMGESQASASDRTAPSSATVVEGIRRTLHYFRSEIDDRPIHRITLCGEMSASGDLASELAELFPRSEVVRHQHVQWPGSDTGASEFDEASAVAAASGAARTRGREFDLVPMSVRERRAGMTRVGAGVVVALLLAPVLTSDAMNRTAAGKDKLASLHAVERVVDGLRIELASYDEDQVLEATAQRQTDRVNELLDQEYGFTTIIRQLAEATPQDSFLLSLRIQRAQRGESPLGYNGPPPAAVLSATGVTRDLDGVGRWLQSVDDVPTLAGLWLAQSAVGPYDSNGGTGAVFTIDGAVIGPADPIAQLRAIR